ncbi:MAG TPA: hypothetical protein VN722_06765 [Hanamia sp.]|nr:hypothetical protein [Hanamia sp.]
MKYVLIFVFTCVTIQSKAQKYILLDKTFSQPAFYSNTISVSEKYRGFFPVEKKNIDEFLKALEEIAERLSEKKITGKAKNYQMGCTEFKGTSLSLATGERLDYMLISTCDDIKVSLHLVDAKINKENNAYFVKTWIKYIKNALKQKK